MWSLRECWLLLFCRVLLELPPSINSANILCVSAVGSPSHDIWNREIALGLVAKGHNVTYLSPDVVNRQKIHPKSKPIRNYTEYAFEGLYKDLHGSFNYNEMVDFHTLTMMQVYYEWSYLCCEKAYESDGMQVLLDTYSADSFDIILIDITIGPCLSPLIEKFGYKPTVGITAFLLPAYISYNFGNNLSPAYMPMYHMDYSSDMSLFQRVINVFYTYVDTMVRNLYEYGQQEAMYRRFLPEIQTSWQELDEHISLVLSNTDPLLHYPQALPPNIIPVGGLNAKPAAAPENLPNHLRAIFAKAQRVILFSLGTNVQSKFIDNWTLKQLLDAFAVLQPSGTVVLWKFEGVMPLEVPPNVHLHYWLPQNDILAHPKTQLFISHCGALSTFEAIYHAVPIIGVPFFVDQFQNVQKIVFEGVGLQMHIHHVSKETVLERINEVFNNNAYYRRMKRLSERYRDQPTTPLERAIFWIEYAIRHNGTHFLNSPHRRMPFYQRFNLDVALTVIMFFVMALYLFKSLIINRYFFTGRTVAQQQHQQQNYTTSSKLKTQ